MRMTTTHRCARSKKRGIALRRSLAAAVAWAGAVLLAGGCSAGWDAPPLPADAQPLLGDADCAADNEPSQGDPCSQDCLTATCGGSLGRRICTCEGGVFLQCACLPPDNWPYKNVPAAPYCDDLTGQPKYLSGETCRSPGLKCFSSSFPEQSCECRETNWVCGTTEDIAPDPGAAECESFGSGLMPVLKGQPCDNEWELCISREYNDTGTSPRGCFCAQSGAQLLWTCGATNRWFRAQ